MIDLQDRTCCPTLEEVGEYVRNDVFEKFCRVIKETYKTSEKIEFSACSLERGWNVKFKKAGKSLCTIYPRESFFTVLVVIGNKEKEAVEAILPELTHQVREIYHKTEEGNGQRWLMIPVEDEDSVYEDVLRLIAIRRTSGGSRK